MTDPSSRFSGIGPAGLPGPNDPPAVTIVNPQGRAAALLVCDHASNAIPAALDDLGLDVETRNRHIAWDIGAAEVARHLAEILDAPAILSGYSRLVVDCNRALDDPTAMRQISDRTVIPGNRGLDATARAQRADSCYWPYHRAIAATIASFAERRLVPAVISVHSCCAIWRGVRRPWHVGVLSNSDRRMADPLIALLSRDSALCIGDNQPYSGFDPHGYTIETHALAGSRPNVLLEIRQDLIGSSEGARHWAGITGAALAAVLAHPELVRARNGAVRRVS